MTTKKGTKKSVKRAAKKATKGTAKKSAAKRASKKPQKGRRELMYAEGPACFWVHEGPILTSLVDLEAVLREMDEELYRYHTGGGQNDFAEWVENVLSDKACGTALRKARKPSTAATAVRKRLVVYQY